MTHPECDASVIELSDYIGSTADIITYAKNGDGREFIICTEDGVDYKLVAADKLNFRPYLIFP